MKMYGGGIEEPVVEGKPAGVFCSKRWWKEWDSDRRHTFRERFEGRVVED